MHLRVKFGQNTRRGPLILPVANSFFILGPKWLCRIWWKFVQNFASNQTDRQPFLWRW